MSLTGVLAPKFIGNIATTRDEIDLFNSVILKDEADPDVYSVASVRTGKKVFTKAGKHWIFQVKVYLWKYANPEAKYLELKSYEGTQVLLYRHSDGSMFYDTYDNEGVFVMTSLVEDYIERNNFRDIVTLTFESAEFVREAQITEPIVEPACLSELYADDTTVLPPYYTWYARQGMDATAYSYSPQGEMAIISNEIGIHSAVRYLTDKHMFENLLTAVPVNVLIFVVNRQGGITDGNIIDFRDAVSAPPYNLILNARTNNNTRVGYIFGSSIYFSDIVAHDSSVYKLRLYRMEGNKFRFYESGTLLLETTDEWSPQILNGVKTFGGSASNNYENAQFLAHLSVYSCLTGQKFKLSTINSIAQGIVGYFGHASISWTNLTR